MVGLLLQVVVEQDKHTAATSHKVMKRNLKSAPNQESHIVKVQKELTKRAPHVQSGKYTFATLLCDDRLLEATSVLVYSIINYAKTIYPVTVMTLPGVTKGENQRPVSQTIFRRCVYCIQNPFRTYTHLLKILEGVSVGNSGGM